MHLALKLAPQGVRPNKTFQVLPEVFVYRKILGGNSKPDLYKRSGFFMALLFVLSCLFIPGFISAAETDPAKAPGTKTLSINIGQSLSIDWDYQFSYQLQLPDNLEGNWLLSIEQRGVNITPILYNAQGVKIISTDAAIFTVGIERLAFAGADFNAGWVQLPKTRTNSPGGLVIRLQQITNPALFALLRQVMAGTAFLHNKDTQLATGIDCKTDITDFGKDPGPAAYCFKAASEHYLPEFKPLISAEELDYFLADSVRRLGLLKDAQRLYLPLVRQQQNLRIQALSLHGLAWTVWQSGQEKIGESFAQQAVASYQAWQKQDLQNRGIRYQQLSVRNIACLILHDQELLEQAEACYLQLLPEVQQADDQETEDLLVGNLGGIYYQRGEISRARIQFEKKYIRARSIGNRGGLSQALGNIGLTELRGGNLQAALHNYQQAAQLAPGSTAAARIESYRRFIADIYRYMGDTPRAYAIYKELEPEAIARGDKLNLGEIHYGLATVARVEGRVEEARKYYLQELKFNRERENNSWVVDNLLTLAEFELEQAEHAAAASYLEQVKPLLPDVETEFVRIRADFIQGKFALSNGNYQLAITRLQAALTAYQQAGDQYNQALVNMELIDAYVGIEQWAAAEKSGQAAIELLTEMRPENISLDLRASFSGIQRLAYTSMIDFYLLRWQQDNNKHWAQQALIWAESARAQTLREAASGAVSSHSLSQELQHQRRDLSGRLNGIATLRLLAREKQQLQKLSALDQDYERTLSALEIFDQQYLPAEHTELSENTFKVDLFIASLPADTAVLAFHLGDKQAALWVLTAAGLETRLLPPATEIHTNVQQLRSALRRPGGFRELAVELAWLGKVLDPQLSPTIKRLQIVADGVLHQLPFAVLPLTSESSWLQAYTLSYSPYIGTAPTTAGQWQSIRIFADPAYEQASVAQVNTANGELSWPSDLGLYRLRGSAVEAQVIAELASKNLLATNAIEVLTGTQATRSAVLQPSQTEILHFATHGIFSAEAGSLSGLVLAVANAQGQAQPWLLTAQELYHAPIAARLVVMSACDAGAGKLNHGEGLLGLVRAFMYAGVEEVVSSQWKVSDRAAVALMEKFYRGLFANKQTVPQALRQAQLEFLSSDRYSDPFYWAGFSDFQLKGHN